LFAGLLWKVREAKDFIAASEFSGIERLVEDLSVDVAGSPASVEEFPMVVVEEDGGPGVAGCVAGWGAVVGSES
jgi:hypothetical protein